MGIASLNHPATGSSAFANDDGRKLKLRAQSSKRRKQERQGRQQEINDQRIQRDRAQQPFTRNVIDPRQSQENSGKTGKGSVVEKWIGGRAGNEIENCSNSCKL